MSSSVRKFSLSSSVCSRVRCAGDISRGVCVAGPPSRDGARTEPSREAPRMAGRLRAPGAAPLALLCQWHLFFFFFFYGKMLMGSSLGYSLYVQRLGFRCPIRGRRAARRAAPRAVARHCRGSFSDVCLQLSELILPGPRPYALCGWLLPLRAPHRRVVVVRGAGAGIGALHPARRQAACSTRDGRLLLLELLRHRLLLLHAG